MSNSKKDSREPRGRNYSFSSNHENYDHAEPDRLAREPLRETDVIRNYSPSRFDPDLKTHRHSPHPAPPYPLQPVSPELIALHQEDQIRKLERIIYYLTGDCDILKEECAALQLEMAVMTGNFAREKEACEAETRKLREMLKDKESECESVARALRKEKEIYEQENERMNYQLKATIERKTDEIYAVTRQKETENHQTRRTLEANIEQLKLAHQKELAEREAAVPVLTAQLDDWRARCEALEQEIAAADQRSEEEKLRLREEHEIYVSDLQEGYHRAKVQLMDAAKQIANAQEQNAQIEREALLLEIAHLKHLLSKYLRENEEVHGIIFEANREHEEEVKGYLALVAELQARLQAVHRQREQEMDYLKIKAASLHSLDLESAQELFNIKISSLADHLARAEAENTRLKGALQQEREKLQAVILQMKEKDSQLHQQLFALKLKNAKILEDFKSKAEREKAAIAEQHGLKLKEFEEAARKIAFQEEELKKIRKLLDKKSKEGEETEQEVSRLKGQLNAERLKAVSVATSHEREWSEERENLKHEIAAKAKEIQRLNAALLNATNDESRFDCTPLEREIKDLREKLKAKSEEARLSKQKAEELKAVNGELVSQNERLKREIMKDVHESAALWQEKSKEKAQDIERFYERKLEFILLEKEQRENQSQESNQRFAELSKRHAQLEDKLQELLASLAKRSELEEKVVNLGLDINLVNNKQQLFEY